MTTWSVVRTVSGRAGVVDVLSERIAEVRRPPTSCTSALPVRGCQMNSTADELDPPTGQYRSSGARAVPGLASVADELPASDRVPMIAPLMARLVGAVVFTGFAAIAFIHVLIAGTSGPLVALSVPLLLVMVAIPVVHFTRPGVELHRPRSYAALVAQAILVYLPLWWLYGESWIGTPVLLAGTVLVALPQVPGRVVFVAVVVSTGATAYVLTHSALLTIYCIVAVAVFGLQIYGLTRLTEMITALEIARRELAVSAVANERLRFARDLHELLGHTLSTIATKGERALRLLPRNRELAQHELANILAGARRALSDVRTFAHGYGDHNLDEESRTAESLLASSRVEVRLDRSHGDLPVHVRAMLAAALHEGVANVLEHSNAVRCEISVQQRRGWVSLNINNDGVDATQEPAGAASGSGLNTLSGRVAQLGGLLTAGLDANGKFSLRLDIPATTVEERYGTEEQDRSDESNQSVAFARVLAAVVFAGQAVITALHFPQLTDQSFPIVVSSSYLFLMLAIQLHFAAPNTRLRSRASHTLLAAQAALVYLPLLQFGLAWLALPGFVAGSALLVLRPVVAWPVFVLLAVSAGLGQYVVTGTFLESLYSSLSAVIHGAVVYGLTWMIRSIAELRAMRVQLAKVAVAEERLRFARDLHDLLGLGLSAIALKSELAHELTGPAPDKAREELADIIAISRLALMDVRLVARGVRNLSLDEEFRSTDSLLAAAGVNVRTAQRVGQLPERIGTLLATVLREGVNNVLRHSEGKHCEITVEQQNGMVCLDIVNDGVSHPIAHRSNGGISNLSYRVALFGGELTAGLESDGRFRLRAIVPT